MPKFIFIFIAILISCGGSSNDEPVTAVEIKLSEEKQYLMDSVYLDTLQHIIFLETNQHSVIRNIDRVFIHDNQIVILDASQGNVLVYDLEGNYIRNIQRLGKGPGEYLQVVDMFIDETRNEMLLLCGRPYKILHLSFEGEFIRSTPIRRLYREFAMDSQNTYAYSLGDANATSADELFQVDVLNIDNGQPSDSWLKQSKFSYFNHRTTGKAVNLSSSLLVSRHFDNSIYEIADGKLESRYSFNFEAHNFPKEIPKIDDFGEYVRSNKILYTITDAVETAKAMIFQSNIGTFVFDKDNKILTRFISGMRSSNFSFSLGDYQVIGNKSGYLAFFAHPTRLKMIEKIYKEQSGSGNENVDVKKFLDFAQKLRVDDNPVMFVYKLKE